MIASQLSVQCDVINNWLWRHQQNENQWYTGMIWKYRRFFSTFIDSLYRVRNKITYVLSWRAVSALTRMLFWCLFPSLLRNSENGPKITLSWALKPFVTRVHALFSIYVMLGFTYAYVYACMISVTFHIIYLLLANVIDIDAFNVFQYYFIAFHVILSNTLIDS